MENTNTKGGFNVFIKSDVKYLDLMTLPQKAINFFSHRAVLFDLFCSSELNFQDVIGAVVEMGLPELLDINITLKDFQTDESKEIQLVLDENQGQKYRNEEYISCQLILNLFSKYYRKNIRKKKTYKDKISNIVKTIVKEDFELDSSKIDVYETSDTENYHVRGNLTTEEFLRNLKTESYSLDYPKSPFVCYFDFYQNFHFVPLDYLFSQESVATLTLKKTTDASFDVEAMKDYRFYSGDLKINRHKYITTTCKIDDNADYVEEENKLESFFSKSLNSSDKFYIIKNFVQGKVFSFDDYGLVDTDESYLYKGRLNSSYLDSLLTNRFDIVDNFSFAFDIGKVVTLNIPKTDGNFGSFQSGKYLIIDYSLFYDEKGVPYVDFTVAKPGRTLEKNNVFYGKTI